MATTAIWDVRDNLKRVLDYCANPHKTMLIKDWIMFLNIQHKTLKLKNSFM